MSPVASSRIEKDLLGTLEVPADAYYGIQTLRAVNNFRLSGVPLSHYPKLVVALAMVKQAAADANRQLGHLPEDKHAAISEACARLIRGDFHEQFVVDMIQGGAGTSTNMNANEVIANIALEAMGHTKGEYKYLHPNNDVNMAQSTNDAYPTAIRLGLLLGHDTLLASLDSLIQAFAAKGVEFAGVLKMGRTQLQDAVPMTLGQEFHAFATTLGEDLDRLRRLAPELLTEVNLGGTAIGTGINADERYLRRIIPNLSKVTGLELVQASDLIDATQNLDGLVAVSGAVKTCAVNLSKMSNDLRLMSSGPRCGFSEINLPPRQNGSSIMPGKVNPVIPEVVSQVAFNIIGNDVTVTMAAEAGQLELNAFEPIIFYNLIQSVETLTYAVHTFVDNCVTGITANRERCRDMVEHSVGIITALCPHVGYEKAAEVAKRAIETGAPVRRLILEEGLLDEAALDKILDPYSMTEPGISGKELLEG